MSVEGAILDLQGVAAVSVDRSGDAIVGIKVELEDGADEQRVASMIRSILEEEGYRSRVAPERIRVEPETPPMPPPLPTVEVVSDASGSPAAPARSKKRPPGSTLGSVVVDEGREGASITVVDSVGNRSSKVAGSTQSGRRTAIVEAVAELLGETPAPRCVEVVERDDGVVLVVLEDGTGSRRAGASVRRAGVDFAFAAAVWSALLN